MQICDTNTRARNRDSLDESRKLSGQNSVANISCNKAYVSRVHTTLLIAGNDDTYHVEKLIGSGAFAKVYLARKRGADFDPDEIETDDESFVVLKVIFPL